MNSRNLFSALALAGYLAAALVGCGRSPQVTFYTLAAMSGSDDTPRTASPCSVAVFPVTLPEFVDRPQLVRASGGSRVDVLEFHRWAEPLKVAIPRLMAENLSRLLKTERVSAYPQSAANDADYRVVTDFQRFESSGNTVIIDALWSIRTPTGVILKTGRTRLNEAISGDGQDGLVAAYSRALTGLSREIAGALQTVCAAPR
ncbi:MAG: membrane integrity-associated transporter subunit PqiC [Desulfuromonadales bacterium]|nr:membrane integrity-associated transporter subunit PqiC [Desulfuromonadales bacterium]